MGRFGFAQEYSNPTVHRKPAAKKRSTQQISSNIPLITRIEFNTVSIDLPSVSHSSDGYSIELVESELIAELKRKNILLDGIEKVLDEAKKVDADAKKRLLEDERIKQEEKKAAEAAQSIKNATLQIKAEQMKHKQNNDEPRKHDHIKSQPETIPKKIELKNIEPEHTKKESKQSNPHIEKIQRIKLTLKPVLKTNKALAQRFFDSKCKINTRIGQIQNSKSKIAEISSSISNILNQSATDQTLYTLLLHFCSKSIMHQAEKEVSVRPVLAYSLSLLVIEITRSHPEFMSILLGRHDF